MPTSQIDQYDEVSEDNRVASLLTKLGVDDNLHKQIVAALILRIADLLTKAKELAGYEHCQGCTHAFEHAAYLLRRSNLDAVTGRRGNPLSGKTSNYPVVACLLEPVSKPNKPQFDRVCMEILRISLYEDETYFNLEQLATHLRLSANVKYYVRSQILANLPVSYAQIKHDELNDFFLRAEKVVLEDEQAKIFLRLLKNVFEAGLGPSFRRVKPKTSTTRNNPNMNEDIPLNGGIINTSMPTVNSEYETIPDNKLFIYESSVSEDDTTQISDKGIDALARGTGYWITRIVNRTPVDNVLLTDIERKILSQYLSDAVSDKDQFSVAAMIISLMLSTGRDIDDVVDITIGLNADISSEAEFCVPVLHPDDGYIPSENEQELYHQPVQKLILPLPTIVKKLIEKTIIVPRDSKIEIGEAISCTEDEVKRLVGNKLKQLRQHGKYRIDRPRIRSALRNELAIATKDPLMVYLITHKKNELMPVSGYYKSLQVSNTVAKYVQCTKRIFDG